MTENEVFSKFEKFGYTILKAGGRYHVFDRRLSRRVYEFETLSQLSNHGERILLFDFMTETLGKTINAFREMFSPAKVPEIQTEPEAVSEEEQKPEQEESSLPPAVPESGLIEKVCPTCGKTFKTPIKQRKYCSEQCYPSEVAKRSKNGSEVC